MKKKTTTKKKTAKTKKQTKYVVLKCCHIMSLEEQTNTLLDAGWECIGGVAFQSGQKQDYYLQAMVKYNDKP